MSAEIDRLEINIEASASSAAEKITQLADSLEKIANNTNGIKGVLTSAAEGFTSLKESTKYMGNSVTAITKLTEALRSEEHTSELQSRI